MIDLSVNIGGLELQNPVMTASGTFGYAEEFKDFFDLNQIGAIVTKTVTPKPRPGNPPRRIVEYPRGMLNSIGLPNVGLDGFLEQKMPFLDTLSCPIVVNVAGKTAEDFAECARRLDGVEGIAAFELNFSCPNVKEGGISFSADPLVAESVTALVRNATRKPLIAKLTPNVTSIGDIGRAVENGGADAVSAVNTFLGMSVDIRRRVPKIPNVTAGYSGPAIKPMALAKVWELVQAVNIPVIGIGGIATADDALEFLIAGASAIQVGTASFSNPRAVADVLTGIVDYCETYKIQNMSEIIGSLSVELK